MKQCNFLFIILALCRSFTVNAMEPNKELLGKQLIKAVEANNLEKVKRLIARGADLNQREFYGMTLYDMTALMIAASRNYFSIVECLIETGVDVNVVTSSRETALMDAASKGSVEALVCLLRSGAYVNLQAGNGMNALMYAAFRGKRLCCELLLQYGADYTLKNQYDETVLNHVYGADADKAEVALLFSDPEKIAAVISRRENNPALEQGFKRITTKHHTENENVCQALFNRELGIE